MEEKNWYEVKTKYVIQGEDQMDSIQDAQTVCLIKAVSFADAEAIAAETVAERTNKNGYHAADIETKACAIRKYAYVLRAEGDGGGSFYKSKVIVDNIGSMESEVAIIEACSFADAVKRIDDNYHYCDFEIDTVQKTPIKCVVE